MNPAFASLNDLHPEELVSRIGNKEAALGRTNDIDFLACTSSPPPPRARSGTGA